MRILIAIALILSVTTVTTASAPGPYAGQQDRPLKALSWQEVQDYLDGKGMGLAKAAELNHYPGPLHVLELADKLKLTAEQRDRSQKIFAHMQQQAKRAGKALIDKEQELNHLFATGAIDNARLSALLRDIGQLQADVRRVHLQAHLEQKAVLSPAQIAAYDTLRGYTAADTGGHDHQQHTH